MGLGEIWAQSRPPQTPAEFPSVRESQLSFDRKAWAWAKAFLSSTFFHPRLNSWPSGSRNTFKNKSPGDSQATTAGTTAPGGTRTSPAPAILPAHACSVHCGANPRVTPTEPLSSFVPNHGPCILRCPRLSLLPKHELILDRNCIMQYFFF